MEIETWLSLSEEQHSLSFGEIPHLNSVEINTGGALEDKAQLLLMA
jgi:hypothetical protein